MRSSQRRRSTDRSLSVGFQATQDADLLLARVDDACGHVVVGVRVDSVQQLHPEARQLGSDRLSLQSMSCFEDLLRLL